MYKFTLLNRHEHIECIYYLHSSKIKVMGSCVCRRTLRFLNIDVNDIKVISNNLKYINMSIPTFVKMLGCQGIHTSTPNAYIVIRRNYVRQVVRKGEPVYERVRSYGMEYDNIDTMVAMILMAQKWKQNSCKENRCEPTPNKTTRLPFFSCTKHIYRVMTKIRRRSNNFSDV